MAATLTQGIVIGVFIITLVLFIIEKWRYDDVGALVKLVAPIA